MKSAKISLSLIAAIGSLTFAAVAQQTTQVAPWAPPNTNSAVVPQLVNFSGILTDVNGKPLTGVVGVTFSLYQGSEGGTPLWTEIQNVEPAKGGHYTVMLGSTSSAGLPQDLFVSGEARWLGVQAEGQAEAPRILLVAVPYALKAGDAETIGGLPASAFVLANSATGSNSGTKSVAAAVSSSASKNSAPPANPAVTGKGTVNYIPMWDTTSDIIDSIIFQKSSEIGISTTTPAALLDVLPDQGVLGHVPDRRGQVGHGVLQARVRRAEAVFLIRGPAQVHPARFLGERVPERLLGQRGGGAPVQVTRALVPDQLTPGERDEQVIGWPVRPPPGDLPGHPARLGRLRGGHQDQPGGAGHRLLDRGPQVRRGGQAGLVPEHVQGPHPVPGLGEVLQLALEPRGDRRVEPVAVGDEGVVAPLLACRHVPPGTVRPAFPVLPPFVTKSYKGIATGYRASRSR